MRTFILILLFFGQNIHLFSQQSWTKVLPGIGTFSSPRLADLNNDGTKDIIMGAGRLEFQACDSAVMALDGQNGAIIWKNSARDQIFGSAGLYDITGDKVPEVFINGRSSEFLAIEGTTGRTIWRFDTLYYSNNHQKRWFNFYNPQFIPDIDGDGLNDILVANGGDIWVKPFDEHRAAGRLVILSSAKGTLLAEAEMPDKREIYMSVAINIDTLQYQNSKIIFGTGGETVPGNLYVGSLDMVLKGNMSTAILLASGNKKGFIAPPGWVDINGDSQLDIVAHSVDGRILTFNGKDNTPIWQNKLPDTEAYSSMAVGCFNKDNHPDFFVSFAQGVWPDLSWTRQAMFNGKNGQIEYVDSLGYYQTSSPVVMDLNGDGVDEAILSVDYQVIDAIGKKSFFNTLYAIDFENKETAQLIDGIPGHNVSATPWIGDINNDSLLDIVFSQGTNQYKTYTFDGLRVNCLSTTIPIKKPIKWGAYMGSSYNGVFKN